MAVMLTRKESRMLKTFVVTEIWVRQIVVRSQSLEDVLTTHEPTAIDGLDLSNWHAIQATKKAAQAQETRQS